MSDDSPPLNEWLLAWDAKHAWRDRPPIVAVRWDGERFVDRHGVSYGNITHWRPMLTINQFSGWTRFRAKGA